MLMTHDERISSYIDNEFSSEQEQEFLISLAASEGLRRSFRSELVLKKVLHRDEATVNPPRKLRGAVFASLGLGGAGITMNKANATQSASRGMLKALFATKLNTLVTVAGISLSALAGYGVRSVVSQDATVTPSANVTQISHTAAPAVQNTIQPAVQQPSQAANVDQNAPVEKKPAMAVKHQHHIDHPAVSAKTEQVSGATGGGVVGIEPPKVTH
jgi:hypothetical protein